MLYDRFSKLAKDYYAIYDRYGNTFNLAIGGEESNFDNFHTSYVHSAFNVGNKTPAYELHEPIPIFEDLFNFVGAVSPDISAINLYRLLNLCSWESSPEHGMVYNQYFINQYISIQTVYDFLRKYNYC